MLLAALPLAPALGAEVAGAHVPDTWAVSGVTLRLNGAGVRRYPLLGVPVYVAALYLERPSHDAAAIIASRQRKLVLVRALRAVGPDGVQAAWRHSFTANCPAPCPVPEPIIERFVAEQPGGVAGDTATYLIEGDLVETAIGGRIISSQRERGLGALVLATFIGPAPPTQELKRALLGQGP